MTLFCFFSLFLFYVRMNHMMFFYIVLIFFFNLFFSFISSFSCWVCLYSFLLLILYCIKFVKLACLSISIFPVLSIIFYLYEFTFNFWMQYIIDIIAYCNFVWIS